jgi:hypothetical protein
MHWAIFHVRARHRAAGTSPATFGDLIREAAEQVEKDKQRLGVKST